MSKFQFIIIGYGHIGKRHAAIVAGMEGCEVIGIVESRDQNPETRIVEGNVDGGVSNLFYDSIDGFLREHSFLNTKDTKEAQSSQYEEKTNSHNPKLKSQNLIAVIATPNNIHCQQAIQCLNAGMHVVIEKPMGLTATECREVIDTAKANNKQVFCVMQNRYSPPSVWLKEIMGSGRLGKLFHVQVNCIWNRNADYYKQSDWKGILAKDGGTLFTQFSHFVDTLHWLFGDLTPTSARFYNFNHPEIEFEDSGFFDFEIRNGGIGSFHYSTSAFGSNLESSITILGENGSVKVGGQYMDQVIACNIKDYQMPELTPTLPPNNYGHYKGSASNHEFVYRNMVDVLNGKADIDCKAEEGLRVVETIETVYRMRDLSKLKTL